MAIFLPEIGLSLVVLIGRAVSGMIKEVLRNYQFSINCNRSQLEIIVYLLAEAWFQS